MGAPGSGKDTQVEKLQGFLDLTLISSGDITRHLAEKNKEAEKIMDDGGLLPDKFILEAISKKISGISAGHGFILDGFPRTLEQAKELENILAEAKTSIESVIFLDVPKGKLIERLSKRTICPICDYVSMTNEEKCPTCEEGMEKRDDDKPEIVEKRIEVYIENTLPLKEYYKNRGLLLSINGDKSVDDVAEEIKQKIS